MTRMDKMVRFLLESKLFYFNVFQSNTCTWSAHIELLDDPFSSRQGGLHSDIGKNTSHTTHEIIKCMVFLRTLPHIEKVVLCC